MSGFLDGYRAGKLKRSEVVLRDWFAGLAMQGVLSGDLITNIDEDKLPKWSYNMADAMIVIRKEKG